MEKVALRRFQKSDKFAVSELQAAAVLARTDDVGLDICRFERCTADFDPDKLLDIKEK